MSGLLPAGAVTFLLTDVEGSTRLWEEHPDAMGLAIARHDEIVAEAVTRAGGTLVKSRGEGDSAFAVFARPSDGLAAGLDLQRALAVEPWPDGLAIRVRAALHTGEAAPREGDYFAPAVNRAARLRAIAHGGQMILSEATAELTRDGLAPDASLKDLGEHRLKDLARAEHVYQLCHSDLPDAFPPLRSLEVVEHNLPVQRTAFVGRERELEIVGNLLRESRLVTLTGVGGCGKTRLAIQIAAECIGEFSGGAFFVDLGAISNASGVDGAVASAVGLQFGPFAGPTGGPRDEIKRFLGSRRTLLILDNCEHLVDAAADLSDELLAACQPLIILATSREALGVDGERAFAVPSLETPRDGDPAAAESVRLFVDRAEAARPGFALGPDNTDAVAEICRRLDGIPLAIELAAARVAHLSPSQIAERLGDRFRLLTGARRRVQRQQTLQATLDWSYALLEERERTLLRRLAVFPASFELDAAEAICSGDGVARDAVIDLIGSLVAKSLVLIVEDEGATRYRLLETVRLYGEDRLSEAAEADAVRSRHRDHVLEVVEAVGLAHIFGSRRGFRASEAIYEDVRTATEWSEAEDRPDLAARIIIATVLVWANRGDQDDCGRRLGRLLVWDPPLPGDIRCECLSAAAGTAMVQIDVAELDRLSGEAIRACEGHPVAFCVASYTRAVFESFRDPDEALRIVERGLTTVRTLDAPTLADALLAVRGDILLLKGDLSEAAASYEEAGRSLDPEDPAFGRLWGRSGLALAAHLQGDHGRAVEVSSDLTGIATEASASLVYGVLRIVLWGNLALAMAGAGDLDAARRTIRVAIEGLDRTRVPGEENYYLGIHAAFAVMEGRFERASRLLGASGGMIRWPSGYAIYRHYRDRIRTALDPETSRRCRDEGRAMTLDQAIAYALEDAR